MCVSYVLDRRSEGGSLNPVATCADRMGLVSVSDSDLWTTSEVAAYLGVTPGTVSAYRHRGQMPPPAQTLGQRTHLWRAKTIREWQAHRREGRHFRVGDEDGGLDSHEREHPHQWLTRGERDLYESEWVRLSLVDVETPDGNRFEHHVVTLRPAAMTAVVDDAGGRVALVWRHRFAADGWNWELPGGLVEADEEPIVTARRELVEELGITVGSLRHLITFEPMIGMVRSAHHVFATRGVLGIKERTEPNEGGDFEWVDLATVRERMEEGEIRNSGTAIALLHLLAFGVD